jgi:hypothetical protein
MQRIKVRHVLVMLGILIAAYVPWIWAVLQAASVGADVRQNIGWIEKPGLRSLLDFGFDVLEPFYFQQTSIDPRTILIITVPLLLAVAAAKANYFINRKHREDQTAFWLLSILAVVPVVCAFLLSWTFPVSVWGTRHLIVVFPLMMIVVGMLFDAVEVRPLKIALIGMTALLFVAALALKVTSARTEMIWCTWEKQAASIPRDLPQTVYVFEDLVAYHMWFAVRNEPDVRVVKVSGVPDMQEDAAYFLPRGFAGVDVVSPGDIKGDRFWVAFRDMQWNEKHPPINLLTAAGYKISPPHVIDAGGLKSFLVEVRK